MGTRSIQKLEAYEWTCDRCDAKVKFKSHEPNPRGWGSVERSPRQHWMLCADCLGEFPEWFRDA